MFLFHRRCFLRQLTHLNIYLVYIFTSIFSPFAFSCVLLLPLCCFCIACCAVLPLFSFFFLFFFFLFGFMTHALFSFRQYCSG